MSNFAQALRWLRAKAHHMKPIVIIGQHRVTEAVVKHIDAALEQHELLKVRLTAAEKIEAVEAAQQLVEGQAPSWFSVSVTPSCSIAGG